MFNSSDKLFHAQFVVAALNRPSFHVNSVQCFVADDTNFTVRNREIMVWIEVVINWHGLSEVGDAAGIEG